MKKKFGKKILKKNFGNINYKTKKYSQSKFTATKCHTIFALPALFDKTGWKTGSNENVCAIWFKIGSVARSYWSQGLWRFERSREKICITACELLVTRLPHERFLLLGGMKFEFRACSHAKAPTTEYNKKVEHFIHQMSYGVQFTRTFYATDPEVWAVFTT